MKRTLQALNELFRVVHSLILREMRTRFDRNKLGYLWALFEPVTYVLVLFAVFYAVGRPSPIGGQLDLAMFFLTGLIPWFLFAHTASKTMEGLAANKPLLTYPQVTPFSILLSRSLLEMITLAVVFLLLLAAFHYFDLGHPVESFLRVLAAFMTIWLLGMSVGFLNASIKLYLSSYHQTYAAIQRLLFFISGIFFTAEMLPSNIREIALYNPILQGIEWFRSAFFHTYESPYIDLEYLFSVVLVMFVLGLAAQHNTRRLARQV